MPNISVSNSHNQGHERQDADDMEMFYRSRGFAGRVGYGKRPGLLIVDMAVAFNDPDYLVGSNQDSAVEAIRRLLDSARVHDIPVYFITTAYEDDRRDAGLWAKKLPALQELQINSTAVEIDPRLKPSEGEHVIVKKYASSFFGTNLQSLMAVDQVDTVILTGCSTSGCIRAAAIDGISYGFRIIVPEQAVSDRSSGPHRANLFDIDAKYGDVVDIEEVLTYLDRLPGIDLDAN